MTFERIRNDVDANSRPDGRVQLRVDATNKKLYRLLFRPFSHAHVGAYKCSARSRRHTNLVDEDTAYLELEADKSITLTLGLSFLLSLEIISPPRSR